ncbi:hypothetical protein EBU58_10025 [bacterium]|jgi:hypothetical protein|nr:hypothetical protein [Pirellulales bacterium]NBP81031.1 hypothetical protein [bacterium]
MAAPAAACRGTWWRRVGLGLLIGVPALAVVFILLARQQPAFYANSVEGADAFAVGVDPSVREENRQRASGRFLSKCVALAADVDRPGSWSTVIEDDELNAWLRVELPANHPELLPAGVADLRVQFAAETLFVGCRVGGPLGGLAWVEVRLRLLEANRVAMTIERCRLGAVPLPGGIAISRLAETLSAAGIRCEMLRRDGQTQLVAQLPAGQGSVAGGEGVSWWLDGMRIEGGELFLTGTSRRVLGSGR